jgi:transposase-like protein
MNFKTATFRAALAERGMTVKRLAKAVQINPRQLLHVLNEHRKGRLTWRRIENAIDARERALIVELYGPVFGEEPVEAIL